MKRLTSVLTMSLLMLITLNVYAWNSFWTKVGGTSTDQAAATAVYNGKLYCFIKYGTWENSLKYTVNSGAGWGPWVDVPSGTTDRRPAATVHASKLWLFVKGGKDNRIYMRYLNFSVWSNWEEVPGGGLTSHGPAACTTGGWAATASRPISRRDCGRS